MIITSLFNFVVVVVVVVVAYFHSLSLLALSCHFLTLLSWLVFKICIQLFRQRLSKKG